MDAATSKTNSEVIEDLLDDAYDCWEFFKGEFEINHEDFRRQLSKLANFSHMQLSFFTEILRLEARRLDAGEQFGFLYLLQDFVNVKPSHMHTESDQHEPNTSPDLQPGDTSHTDEAPSVSSTDQEHEMSSALSEGNNSFPDDTKSSVSTLEGAQDLGIVKEADTFIMKALKAIKTVAPNLHYKPKHLRRKKFKVIPYEFASVWKNVSSIFSEETVNSSNYQVSVIPKVAWEKVNVAALRKLPTPKSFPILSASPIPQFYSKSEGCPKKCPQTAYVQGENRHFPCNCRLGFETTDPFGTLLGFESNLGVVPVPSAPMFGHIWDTNSSSWLLHAEIPIREMVTSSQPLRVRGKKGRRPPERRTRGRGRGRR